MWEGLDFLGLFFPPFFITGIVFFFLFSTKETLQDWAGNECMALCSHHDVFSLKKETKVGFISDAEQQTPQCFDSQRLSPQGQVTWFKGKTRQRVGCGGRPRYRSPPGVCLTLNQYQMQQVESCYDKVTGITHAGGSQAFLDLFPNHQRLSFSPPAAERTPLEQGRNWKEWFALNSCVKNCSSRRLLMCQAPQTINRFIVSPSPRSAFLLFIYFCVISGRSSPWMNGGVGGG